jgi:hypothetical protein
LTRRWHFTGPLRVNVCLDARCERHFGNSPVQVPYRIKVLPGLKLLGAPPTIALGGAFGAAAPSWAGDIQVPAGAAQPSLSLEWGNSSGPFWGPQFASNLFDLRTAGSRLTVVGQPAPVGELLAFLRLQTTATTSKGRTVALGQDYTLQYTVTGAPELQVLYGPGALQFALPAGSTANTPVQRVTSLVNTGFRIDTFTRVEYLPPGPSGNADAAGFSWLRAGNWGSLLQGYEVGADLYARACPDSVDLVGPPVCLPPGRYEARVYPKRVVTADEIALPLSVTLTVGP